MKKLMLRVARQDYLCPIFIFEAPLDLWLKWRISFRYYFWVFYLKVSSKSFCKLPSYWISFSVPVKQIMNMHCFRKRIQALYSCVCFCVSIFLWVELRNSGIHFFENRGRDIFVSHNHISSSIISSILKLKKHGAQ